MKGIKWAAWLYGGCWSGGQQPCLSYMHAGVEQPQSDGDEN